jgi:multiple sugar transport system ATP-binding protein
MRLGTTFIMTTQSPAEALRLGDQIAVLRDGTLQQLGTPQQVYHTPVNRFVANFIGILPINLLDGTLIEDNGSFHLRFHAGSIQLPDRMNPALLGPRVGQPLLVGIRPEDLIPVEPEETHDIDAHVVPGEEPDTILVSWHGTLLRLKKELGLSQGDKVALCLKKDHIHLFDKQTTLAIAH